MIKFLSKQRQCETYKFGVAKETALLKVYANHGVKKALKM